MTKRRYVIIVLVFLILLVCVLIFFATSLNKNKNAATAPSGVIRTANPGVSVDKSQVEYVKKGFQVGLIANLTPYYGKNFSLYFDLKNSSFVLYINPNNKNEGKNEFEGFIKKNGVDDVSWFQNMFVTYITPTPSQPSKTQTTTSPTP